MCSLLGETFTLSRIIISRLSNLFQGSELVDARQKRYTVLMYEISWLTSWICFQVEDCFDHHKLESRYAQAQGSWNYYNNALIITEGEEQFQNVILTCGDGSVQRESGLVYFSGRCGTMQYKPINSAKLRDEIRRAWVARIVGSNRLTQWGVCK